MITKKVNLLFLTTRDPATIVAEWPFYQNWTLPKRMAELGLTVERLCWRDPKVTIDRLATFDKICFLWCNNYHEHGHEFEKFLKEKLKPAQAQVHGMQVVNDVDFVLWNMDKGVYLPELESAGFLLPKTTHIDVNNFDRTDQLAQELRRASNQVGSKFVLKPAISGSSKLTHLVHDVGTLSSIDMEYLSLILRSGLEGSMIVQAFEPAIADGEYSLVFIAGEHTHTMLKTPKRGEFKCQAEFGGGIAELTVDQTPKEALTAAQGIMKWLSRRFKVEIVPYCRVDGVIRDGQFVLMEVEAIEPHLWLETCANPKTCQKLYNILLR